MVRSLAGSSDGKGKGITAPNPVGQRLAVQRAWREAGEDPATVGLVEGHGTSTRVGDVVVFDVNYGRARYFLATSWASVAGTATCAACHGPERAANPARNPHRIFERPLGAAR